MVKKDEIHSASDRGEGQPSAEATKDVRRPSFPSKPELSVRSSNARAPSGARKTGAIRKFFTIEQVADEHEVAPRTVQRWIADGVLIAHRFGRAVRIAEPYLRAFSGAASCSMPRIIMSFSMATRLASAANCCLPLLYSFMSFM